MPNFLTVLFDTSDFPPRWQCGVWTARHGWLHILSDLAVWGAYVAIPILLAYFLVRRRRHVPFGKIIWLFVIFIFACGTTHLLEAIVFWKPIYRFTGLVKFLTALASWGTVFALIPITPKVLALRSPHELEQEIAERQRAQAELAQKNEKLRRLAVELSAAEQRERKRVAITLHDHFQQILVAAKLGMGQIRGEVGETKLAATLEHVDRLLDESIQASRSLAVELSPPVLYDRGLTAALEWQERHFQHNYGLMTTLDLEADAEPRDPGVQAFLFQAVRELLFNVVKHAGVTAAKVRMWREAGHVRITVADEGKGCTLERIASRMETDGGFGLFSIQQRIELLGGTFHIDTAPGEGFQVTLSAPRELPAAVPHEPAAFQTPREERPVEPQLERSHSRPAIRVLIADDHRMVREGIAGLLQSYEDIEIVGQAENGRTAVELARRLRPDVVVMDIAMPIMDGIDATRSILREVPSMRVVGLSMHEREDLGQSMLSAGAVAYLSKGGPPEALVAAIRK